MYRWKVLTTRLRFHFMKNFYQKIGLAWSVLIIKWEFGLPALIIDWRNTKKLWKILKIENIFFILFFFLVTWIKRYLIFLHFVQVKMIVFIRAVGILFVKIFHYVVLWSITIGIFKKTKSVSIAALIDHGACSVIFHSKKAHFNLVVLNL